MSRDRFPDIDLCCIATAAGALWRMVAAENLRGGTVIKGLLSSKETQDVLSMLATSKSSRARDNALKVVDFLQKAGIVPHRSPEASKSVQADQQSTALQVQAQ